jgi:hypothetical protein
MRPWHDASASGVEGTLAIWQTAAVPAIPAVATSARHFTTQLGGRPSAPAARAAALTPGVAALAFRPKPPWLPEVAVGHEFAPPAESCTMQASGSPASVSAATTADTP